MNLPTFIVLLFMWSLFGFPIVIPFIHSYCFQWLNPIWIYKQYDVNYFGAAMICIFYNLLSPICSICYWVYKLFAFLFTVGRK